MTTLYPTPPPELTLTTRPSILGGFEVHQLEGWEELNLWGHFHMPEWRALYYRATNAGLTNADMMKLMAGEMMRQLVAAQEREFEGHRLPPMYVLDPTKGLHLAPTEHEPDE